MYFCQRFYLLPYQCTKKMLSILKIKLLNTTPNNKDFLLFSTFVFMHNNQFELWHPKVVLEVCVVVFMIVVVANLMSCVTRLANKIGRSKWIEGRILVSLFIIEVNKTRTIFFLSNKDRHGTGKNMTTRQLNC